MHNKDSPTDGTHIFTQKVDRKGYRWLYRGSHPTDDVARSSPLYLPRPWGQASPWLVPLGVRPRRIHPLLRPQLGEGVNELLHRRFAALRDEHITEDVLKFANRFGQLGQGLEVTFEGQAVTGEPLSLWWSQAEEMSYLLAIWDLVAEKREDVLKDLVSGWPGAPRLRFIYRRKDGALKDLIAFDPRRHTAPPRGLPHRDTYGGGPILGEPRGLQGAVDEAIAGPSSWPSRRRQQRDIVWSVRGWLCERINRHLEPMLPLLVPPQFDAVYLAPRTMLDALWLMLLWEVLDNPRPKLCTVCGIWFAQLDAREEVCSNACRQKKYRQNLARKKVVQP